MLPNAPLIAQLPANYSEIKLIATFPHFSAANLFEYFTTPELLIKWWPQEAFVEGRLGGKYKFSWPSMNWRLFGEYTRYEPARQLVFSWNWEHESSAPQRQVEIFFSPVDAGAQLLLTQGVYDRSLKEQEERQNHQDGWEYFLARLGQRNG